MLKVGDKVVLQDFSKVPESSVWFNPEMRHCVGQTATVRQVEVDKNGQVRFRVDENIWHWLVVPGSENGDSMRKDAGKIRFDLIPGGPLTELARLYTIGAAKYSDNGWKKGMAYSRCYAAMQRHLNKWWAGETYDAVDGQHHLAAVAWGAFTLMWYEFNRPEHDDRPKGEKPVPAGPAAA